MNQIENESDILNQIEEGSFEYQCIIFILQGKQILEKVNQNNRYEKLKECFKISQNWESEIKNNLMKNYALSQEKLMILNYLIKNLKELNKNLIVDIKELQKIRGSHESEFNQKNESIILDDKQNFEDDEEFVEHSENESDIREFTDESQNNNKNSLEIKEKQELKLGDNLTPDILNKLYRKDDNYYERLESGDLIKLDSQINKIEEQNGNKKIIKKIITLSMSNLKKKEIEEIKKSLSEDKSIEPKLSFKEFKDKYAQKKEIYTPVVCSNNDSEKNTIKQESIISNVMNIESNDEQLRDNNIQSNEQSKENRESYIKKQESYESKIYSEEMKMPFQSYQETDNQTKQSKISSIKKDSVTNMIISSNQINLESDIQDKKIEDYNKESDTQKNFYNPNNMNIENSQTDPDTVPTKEKFYPKEEKVIDNKISEDYFKVNNNKILTDDSKIISKESINLKNILKQNNSPLKKNLNDNLHSDFREINKTIDLEVEGVINVDKNGNKEKQDNNKSRKNTHKKKIQSFSDLVKESCENNEFKINNENNFKTEHKYQRSGSQAKRRVISIDNSNKLIDYKETKEDIKEPIKTKVESPNEISFETSNRDKKIYFCSNFLKNYVFPFMSFVHEDYRWVKLPSKTIKIIDANLNSSFNSNLSNASHNDMDKLLLSMNEVPREKYLDHVIAPLGFENKVINIINDNMQEKVIEHVSIWSHENKEFFNELVSLWQYAAPYSSYFNSINHFLDQDNNLYEIKEELEENMNDSNIRIQVKNRENFHKNFKKDFFIFNGKSLNLFPFFSFECNKNMHLTSDLQGNYKMQNDNLNNKLVQQLSLSLKSGTQTLDYEESFIAMKSKPYGQLKPFFLNNVTIERQNKIFCIYTSDDAEFRLVQDNGSNNPRVLWFKTNLLLNLKEHLNDEELNRYLNHWQNEICTEPKFLNVFDEVCDIDSGEVKKLFFRIKLGENSFKPGIKLFVSRCGEIRILSQSQHKGKNVLWIRVASLNHLKVSSNKQQSNLQNLELLGDDGSIFKKDLSFNSPFGANIELYGNNQIKVLVNTFSMNQYETNSYRISTYSQVRKEISKKESLSQDKINFSQLKKSSFKKFFRVRGNLFISLPFLVIYSASDGQTKIIDSRNKYFNHTEYFLKQEEPPLIQSTSSFTTCKDKYGVSLMKDPYLDQLGFSRYKLGIKNDKNCQEIVSDDGDKRMIYGEEHLKQTFVWLSHNVDWSFDKPNYLLDERGNRVEDIGNEISREKLIEADQLSQNQKRVNSGSHLKVNKNFILTKYPYFLFFYNPHLKFVNSVSGLKIINLNMYSRVTPTKINNYQVDSNKITSKPLIMKNNDPRNNEFQQIQNVSNVRKQNENKVEINKTPQKMQQRNGSTRKNIYLSNQRPSSLDQRNNFHSERKIKYQNKTRNDSSLVNNDYFGEYGDSKNVPEKKPVRYSSRGINVFRPNFISDNLKGQKGVKVLTGEAALKALRNSVQHFETNMRQSISPIGQVKNVSQVCSSKKNYLNDQPAIDNLGKFINNKMQENSQIKKSYISPVYFDKPKMNIRQNLKVKQADFSENSKSKMISVGKLLNNFTNKHNKNIGSRSNISSNRSGSNIGHSVSIRSRSRSKIQNKSLQKFIPVNEYYSELERQSRMMRESKQPEEEVHFNKLQGVKMRLNVLASKSTKRNLSQEPSNEYFYKYNKPNLIENVKTTKNYNSVEPVRNITERRVSQRIRNIHNKDYSKQFINNHSVINREVEQQHLKNSYLFKEEKGTGRLGAKLRKNSSQNEEVDTDFNLNSKDNYNKSWNVNVNKGLHKVNKEEVQDEDFSAPSFFEKKRKEHNNFNNNFKDKNFFGAKGRRNQIKVGGGAVVDRKNRFEENDDREGEFEEELVIGTNVQRFDEGEYNPYEHEEEELGPVKNQMKKKDSEEVIEEIIPLNNFRVNNDEYNPYEHEEEELGPVKNQMKKNDSEEVIEEIIPLNNFRVNNDDEYNPYEDEEEELGKGNRNNVYHDEIRLNNYQSNGNEHNPFMDEEEELGPSNNVNYSNRFRSVQNSFNPDITRNSDIVSSNGRSNITIKRNQPVMQTSQKPNSSYHSKYTIKHNRPKLSNVKYSKVVSNDYSRPNQVENEYISVENITPVTTNAFHQEYNPALDEEEEMGITNRDINPVMSQYQPINSTVTFGSRSNVNKQLISKNTNPLSYNNLQSTNKTNSWRFIGSSSSLKNNTIQNNSGVSNSSYYNTSRQNSEYGQIRKYPSRKIELETFNPSSAQIFTRQSEYVRNNRNYFNGSKNY